MLHSAFENFARIAGAIHIGKDVWIKKVLNDLYGIDEKNFDFFVKEHFGDLAGFAQQYLFYYMRG